MKKLLLCLIACCSILMAWADATLKGSAPAAVAVGERFRLEYEVNANGKNFRCALSEGFRNLSGPNASSQRSMSIINGQTTSSVSTSYTYFLLAEKEGTYTIPAATVQVDGETVKSNEVTIKVLPADKASEANAAASNSRGGASQGQQGTSQGIGKDDVMLNVELSKTKAYEGEAILARVKLYFRNHGISGLSDVKLPNFEGFTVQELETPEPNAVLERYNNANYQMVVLKEYLLYPQRSGEIKIDPAEMTATARIVVTRRSGGFFDMPMDYTQDVDVPVRSAAKKISVTPLPAGKPSSYMGAVGNFSIQSSLSSDHVKSNEAVTYRIEISGSGNVKYAKNPEPEFPADFEVYDPKIDVNVKTTASGQTGKKTIEYTFIPRFAGSFTIPALEYTYFDTKSGQYKTATTQPLNLTVEKGPDAPAASNGGGVADFSGTNQERLKVLGNDIRYLHNVLADELVKEFKPLYGSRFYSLWFILPFVLFVLLAFIYRRHLRLSADLVGTRTRKANKVATRRLKEAAAALKAQDEIKFYEATHKAMFGYVSDKLNIAISVLTHDSVEAQLTAHGVDEALAKQYMDILSTCEFARYAPSHDAHAMDELYKQAAQVIDRLDSTIKKK